ncbi:carboxylesterase/lipase family protein [Carboxylicivirga caseinilyticus]|uniref:carboxylesterase/lipase family protein n=1 Tax=Carboxylicivirga caseinilyticus TaxID=3417572 RepID=UPI003D34E57D|nr:carboxylesterase/lipase family protein [Marinilabiliaceae bacterium A049]
MKKNRRDFFKTVGIGAAGLGLSSFSQVTMVSEKMISDDQQLVVGDDIAIAQTQYGKVQGFILRGIFQFRGIPYGADTSGKNRFMPPQKPRPWKETYPAVWWGNTAPQIMDNRYANNFASFVDHWNYDDVSEDCLRLNVWTPAIKDSKKRPVLVWLHGGGYTNGNGYEQDGYDGENFCRKGDVVFCSINHRLGPIGFSDLSVSGDAKYADSGNVGALDMVAALEWVRDNIAEFGGDPGNVTIMGQSGGGAKVCTLTAMKKAKGLFHKAVPLSGSTLAGKDQKVSKKLGQYIIEEAGLQASEVDKLQELSWREYIDIANKASRRYMEENPGGNSFRGGFGPVADGRNLPLESFYSDVKGLSSDVPMLISTTFHEWSMSRNNAELEAITKENAIAFLTERAGFSGGLGDKAEPVYNAYEKVFPKAKPIEIMTLIVSNRKSAIETANAKASQDAPVYMAWFGWEPPMFNNRMRAFHCLDICFWFNNTDRMFTHTGGGSRPRELSDKMSQTLIRFMKNGNPNGGGLPEWPRYTPEKGATMVLNDTSVVKNDPDREARKLLE